MDGGAEGLIRLPREQQWGVDPVEAVGVSVGGQVQAAVVTGHQASRDGHLCPRSGRTIRDEVKLIQA